jgi:ABC-2 type transport system ATP-binding protein
VANRVALLKEGRLVAVDTVEGLRATAGGPSVHLKLAEPPPLAAVRGLSSRPEVLRVTVANPDLKLELVNRPDDLAPLLAYSGALGLKITAVSVAEPTLEQVFDRFAA